MEKIRSALRLAGSNTTTSRPRDTFESMRSAYSFQDRIGTLNGLASSKPRGVSPTTIWEGVG